MVSLQHVRVRRIPITDDGTMSSGDRDASHPSKWPTGRGLAASRRLSDLKEPKDVRREGVPFPCEDRQGPPRWRCLTV